MSVSVNSFKETLVKTAANWVSANTILSNGQFGKESDTGLIKCGDGSTAWNSLAYVVDQAILVPTGDITNTLNTAIDITGLSFSIPANTKYKIDAFIHIGCNNTGGVKFTHTFPAGATVFLGSSGTTTANTASVFQGMTVSGTLNPTAYCQENNSNRGVRITGTIETGVTAGTWQLQFAAGTATQTATVYEAGTIVTINKL